MTISWRRTSVLLYKFLDNRHYSLNYTACSVHSFYECVAKLSILDQVNNYLHFFLKFQLIILSAETAALNNLNKKIRTFDFLDLFDFLLLLFDCSEY